MLYSTCINWRTPLAHLTLVDGFVHLCATSQSLSPARKVISSGRLRLIVRGDADKAVVVQPTFSHSTVTSTAGIEKERKKIRESRCHDTVKVKQGVGASVGGPMILTV